LSWIDIVLVVVLAVSTFSGLKTGIIKAALTLAGIIVGIVLAGRYHATLAAQLTFISEENVAKIVAFAIILVVVMAIAAVLAKLLKWTASAVLLGWVNRLGGAILGLLLGALFCAVLLAIWVKFFGLSQIVADSSLAPILLDRLPLVLALLPEEFDAIRSFFD